MISFLNKLWVQIVAWVFIIIGTAVLIIGGTSVGNIDNVVELVFGIIEAIGLLVIFLKKMLQKKDTAEK